MERLQSVCGCGVGCGCGCGWGCGGGGGGGGYEGFCYRCILFRFSYVCTGIIYRKQYLVELLFYEVFYLDLNLVLNL